MLMLCMMPLLMACSSDDDNGGDETQDITYSELYTGDYEWATSNNSDVIRFISENKALWVRTTLMNCYYYFKTDENGDLRFCCNVCTNGWEYFSTEESVWYTFKWNNDEHTSFTTLNGKTFTKRTAQTIIETTE